MSVVLAVMAVAGMASLVAVAATVGCSVPPYDEPPDRARLATLRTVAVGDLVPGETVKVVGRARLDEASLRSPQTGRRCLGHVTQRRVKTHVARCGATVVDSFWLEDSTGRVRVRFRSGRLAVRPDHAVMLGAGADEAEGVLSEGDRIAVLASAIARANVDEAATYRAGARTVELHLVDVDHVICDIQFDPA